MPVRYERQLGILGAEGQEALASSTVAVVGLGGLGSVVSLLLAYAGVGKLIVVDPDRVEESNLNRQILYGEADVGMPKVFMAARRLREVRRDLIVKTNPERIDMENVMRLIKEADIVVDALDNWHSRLVLADAAWDLDIPLVHGAVNGVYGQVTVIKKGKTSCLHCIAPPDRGSTGSQTLVTSVSMVATIQAMEAIKVATGLAEPLYNKLAFIDALEPRIDFIQLAVVDCNKCKTRRAG